MTTTAHEDQFTDAPEPVRQTYDTGSILRRNVADLEIALRKHTAKQADCRACVNRGRVNGLSQETYCESCVHEDRNWRKNHFLDAAADRLLEGGE